ncbi:unnamed protein product [Vicia faba]|uniref:MYND-type domain-containing protein n=2 Tax=Vicia faba TaxID=3906 RepID=A0AAV0YZ28_VICFA|nr:unnamed protein product [Vicia faba]
MDLHLKGLFDRYQEQFGCGPGLGPGSGTCLMKVDDIAPNFIRSIYKASAALYRTEPWKRLRPVHYFGVRVGKDSDWHAKKQPFPCVQFIGGDGGDIGFYMYRSESDAKKMTGARETVRVPNVEVLRVTYEVESLMFPLNRKMIKSLSLEASGSDRFPVIDVARCTVAGDLQFRSPTLDELRFVYAFMKAICMVHPLLVVVDREGGSKYSTLVNFEPFIETVDVHWPPEVTKGGYDLVAVTVSHPPGRAYDEKSSSVSAGSTPTKYVEPPREDTFIDANAYSSTGLRQCAMCEREVFGEESICCGRCRTVVYCGSICQKQHWNETHKSLCGLYKAMMEREEELAINIFLFPCSADQPCKWLESLDIHQKGMWRRKCSCYSHCPFGLLPLKGGLHEQWGELDEFEYPRDTSFNNHFATGSLLLSGWSEYYNLRSLPLSSPAADILSHPLTVYHILTTLNVSSKNLLLKGKEVIIHYLGPEGELDWMPAFAEVGHLLNGLGNVQIVMVGPEVPTNLSGTTSGIGSRVRVNFVRGVYQVEASYLPSPHVVIALNSRLENYSSWVGALDLIKSMGVPAFFTDQSEASCVNAKQVIRNAGLHITHPVTPNPFRSPVKNITPSSNLPSYSNGFVFGVNT